MKRPPVLWEYRLWQFVRRLVHAKRGGPDWPNRDHPPMHRYWRRLSTPWKSRRRICYYCGLRTGSL